jgi:AcrR family transcriptional regulator
MSTGWGNARPLGASRHRVDSPRRRLLDGRLAKGEQTRRSVVEALVDLVDAGLTTPTSRQVADRAGVSVRLIFHHFGGVHGVLLAAVALQAERHRSVLFAIPARGPPALRIQALCRQRRLYFEEMTPVFRVALARAHAEAELRELLAEDRTLLCGQLALTLAPEIRERGADADALLDALEHATGWEAWRSLRDARGNSAPSAERAMVFAAGRLLG